MELRDIARSRRRQEALDAIEFERDRERALLAALEEIATELEGPAVDEETFSRMRPEDAELAQRTLFDAADEFEHDGEGEDWLEEFRITDEEHVDREERLGEVARLEGEIEESRRRRQALERYLEALAPA